MPRRQRSGRPALDPLLMRLIRTSFLETGGGARRRRRRDGLRWQRVSLLVKSESSPPKSTTFQQPFSASIRV